METPDLSTVYCCLPCIRLFFSLTISDC
uniref:Uncharacterized protein n=1 Tax=Arundo donax TaxID=35708 RepID=A0A0A8XWM4_ARUDO